MPLQRSDDVGAEKLADAASVGVDALAGIIVGALEGIVIVDAERRWEYANPAACEMLGRTLEQVQGQDFLTGVPPREHASVMGHFAEQMAGKSALFTSRLSAPDGGEREVLCSTFAIDNDGRPRAVTTFRDVTESRAANRAAAALAQTTAHLVGPKGIEEILDGIARHAVDGTRAVVCGVAVIGDGHTVSAVGCFSAPGHGAPPISTGQLGTTWDGATAATAEEMIEAVTGGSIAVGQAPGKPVVKAGTHLRGRVRAEDGHSEISRSASESVDGVFVPLAWENRVFGLLEAYLPPGTEPTEEELAFYAALADQAAVAVTNTRLIGEAESVAASRERIHLARELHDSVSQALFSMNMHARAAQLWMTKIGIDEVGPLGGSIARLAELTRGAMAEMRTLIFELRPGALAEEGLLAALRQEASGLTAREGIVVTVEGPEERLDLEPAVEEHLYRIVSEALHNVVKHARAQRAEVNIADHGAALRVSVTDDGVGFEPTKSRPGHLGLSTMAERAAGIGAEMVISSVKGGGGTKVDVLLPADRPGATAGLAINAERPAQVVDRPASGVDVTSSTQSRSRGGPDGVPVSETRRPRLGFAESLTEAAALGLETLAEIVARAQDAIAIVGPDLRYAYANTAACRMLGRPLLHMRGRDFLDSFPEREHPIMLDRLPEHLGDGADPFTCITLGADDTEREVVCSTFAMNVGGNANVVVILQDLTRPRGAARAAAALAQTTAQLIRTETIADILAGIARHAVESTRAQAVVIMAEQGQGTLAAVGGYGVEEHGPGQSALTTDPLVLSDLPGSEVLLAGKTIVIPDGRSLFGRSVALQDLSTALQGVSWEAVMYVPLSWEDRVFGVLGVFLPPGHSGPSEEELAFYTALADQAAVAATNRRLTSEAEEAAALWERNHLARELHDSVSQALFSITMHARAAQVSLRKAGLDDSSPLDQSVAQLGELTREAMAEMRALIFELRPGALAEDDRVTAVSHGEA